MKKLLLANFLILFLAVSAQAQDWKLYKEDQFLRIELAEHVYHNHKYNKHHKRIIFRYSNLTEDTLYLSFQRTLTYDGQELEESNEQTFNLNLNPQEILAYSDEQRDKCFYLFVKDEDEMIRQSLSDFDIKIISYN